MSGRRGVSECLGAWLRKEGKRGCVSKEGAMGEGAASGAVSKCLVARLREARSPKVAREDWRRRNVWTARRK